MKMGASQSVLAHGLGTTMPGRYQIVAKFPALTGVRAFASLWVMAYHFREIDVDKGLFYNFGFLDPLIRHGNMGVDVFFVLSGFIITHVYRDYFARSVRISDFLRFVRCRFARIYPVHFVTMILMAMLFSVATHVGFRTHNLKAFQWPWVLSNFTMTQAWFPGGVSMNTPAWSLSAEWFAYLCFPPVYYLLQRIGRVWPWLVVVAAIGTTVLIQMMRTDTGYWPPLIQVSCEFAVGMAAYEIYREFGNVRVGRFGALLTGALVLIPIYSFGRYSVALVIVASAFGFVCLVNGSDIVARVLSAKQVIYAGNISYSLYLCHWVVWVVIRRGTGYVTGGSHLPHEVLMILATIGSLALASLSYHYIENSSRQILRRTRAARELAGRSIGLRGCATTARQRMDFGINLKSI